MMSLCDEQDLAPDREANQSRDGHGSVGEAGRSQSEPHNEMTRTVY